MKPTPIVLKVLNWISLVLLAIATYLTIYWAPQEVTMGNVQRVFYFHVATGWVGMIGFLLAVFSGIMYLRTSDMKWDIIGLAGKYCHRCHLGQADLEYVVDLGSPPGDGCDHGTGVHCIYHAAPGNRRTRKTGTFWRDLRHRRVCQCAAVVPFHPHLAHDPPGRHRQW